jgi:lysophospholipase L1-like esterase
MKSKLATLSVIQLIIIIILLAVIFFQKLHHYKEINQFRLDPLETDKLLSTLGSGENDLWIIGDSRAEQWDTSLLSLLKTDVYNLGIAGQSTKQVLERFKDNLERHCPKYVLVQVGINDLKNIGILDGKRIAVNCIENTVQILNLCKKRDIIAIYTSIFPVGKMSILRKPFWDNSIIDSIKKVNLRIKEYCSENDIFYFDSYSFLQDSKNQDILKPGYQKDFLHINMGGYKVLSRKLSDFLSGNLFYRSE